MIDSIPHCHAENALERDKNQEMFIRFCAGDKVGILSSNVFQTVILKMLLKEAKIKKCGFVSI